MFRNFLNFLVKQVKQKIMVQAPIAQYWQIWSTHRLPALPALWVVEFKKLPQNSNLLAMTQGLFAKRVLLPENCQIDGNLLVLVKNVLPQRLSLPTTQQQQRLLVVLLILVISPIVAKILKLPLFD